MIDVATGSNAINITLNSSYNVFWTIFAGVCVFVLGQLFIELILNPIKRYKKIKSNIAYCLVFYANIYMNPVTTKEYLNSKKEKNARDKIRDKIRKLAAELSGFTEERFLNWPNVETIKKVSSLLIGLSNSLESVDTNRLAGYNDDRVKEIKELLQQLIK